MIYKLTENDVLLEATISLRKSSNLNYRKYKLNYYSGSEKNMLKHGPRVKIYENDRHVATYAIDRNTGSISSIGDNVINKNNKKYMELIISEISYGCLPLILKMLHNASNNDRELLEHYAIIISSADRTNIHSIATAVRSEINDKIFR